MRGTTIDLNGKHMDLEDLRLTAEDLERFGPTLIVDHRNTSGERVLVWSQYTLSTGIAVPSFSCDDLECHIRRVEATT